MLQKLNTFRKQIISYEPKFLILPMVLSVIVPNLLEPTWFWRLAAIVVSSLSIFILCFWGVLSYEAIQKIAEKRHSLKYLYWIMYAGFYFALFASIYIFLVPITVDSYNITFHKSYLVQSQLDFTNTEHGGSVDPWFILQRLQTADKKDFLLLFSFSGYGPGTYDVLYSPYSDFIYEISPVK